MFHQKPAMGFSLVELMIAMTLGLILLLGIGSFFLGAHRNIGTTSEISTIQDKGRFALQSLSADLSRAGFMGPGPTKSIDNYSNAAIASKAIAAFKQGGVVVTENNNAPDSVTIYYLRPWPDAETELSLDASGTIFAIVYKPSHPNLPARLPSDGPLVLADVQGTKIFNSPRLPQGTTSFRVTNTPPLKSIKPGQGVTGLHFYEIVEKHYHVSGGKLLTSGPGVKPEVVIANQVKAFEISPADSAKNAYRITLTLEGDDVSDRTFETLVYLRNRANHS